MSTQCLLLDKMPAEIRNRIYEYTFAPDDDKEVELADATPPTIDLVLANRQIHNESIGLYALAFHDYFRNTNFCISREVKPMDVHQPTILNLRWNHILTDQITRMTFAAARPFHQADDTLELLDTRGGWKHTSISWKGVCTSVRFLTLEDTGYTVFVDMKATQHGMERELSAPSHTSIPISLTRQLHLLKSYTNSLG